MGLRATFRGISSAPLGFRLRKGRDGSFKLGVLGTVSPEALQDLLQVGFDLCRTRLEKGRDGFVDEAVQRFFENLAEEGQSFLKLRVKPNRGRFGQVTILGWHARMIALFEIDINIEY